jgi:hypothetical protein
MMRPAVWTLLLALLLQVFAGSAWALQSSTGSMRPTHCHEPVAPVSAGPASDGNSDEHRHSPQKSLDSHHCCAVGLGTALPSLVQPLPTSTPARQQTAWASLSLSPDLRPPI